MKKLFVSLLCVATFSVIAKDFNIRDAKEFRKIFPENARLEKLAGDFKFTEGPVWVPCDDGYLVFSDIPANQLKKWTQGNGVSVFRADSHNANGNTVDREGRVFSAEHSGRRVARLEKDGTLVTVVDEFEGKKFNSPNDVIVKRDGTIWFTDPDYGLGKGKKEQTGNFVYRFDPKTKQTAALVKDFEEPNGLCFSPNEKKLYVADSGKPRHIRVFDVKRDGTLSNGKVFCAIDKGVPDGIRCDAKGRIWSSAGDGVQIFSPNGTLIGKILVPEPPANLCFGGKDGKTLFITARSSLYAIEISQKN